MSFLIKSCSNNHIMNTSSMDNLEIDIQNLGGITNLSNSIFSKRPNLNLKSLSIKNHKFTNNIIFTKREIAYNKSLEKHTYTFKYKKYSSYFQKTKNQKNKNERNKINTINNKSSNSPLYLTEYAYINKSKNKFNNSSLHSFRKSRSHFYENDKSTFTNISNLENNTSRKNNNYIYNNYLNFCKGQIFLNQSSFLINSNTKKNDKKINLKLYNPQNLLNIFETERENEKKNKLKIELEYKHLYKKRQYINTYRKKGFEKHKYLESFNDYLIEKMNLRNLKEKKNALKDKNEYKLNLINNTINQAKKNYEDFHEIYFVKYNEFIKKYLSKSKNEKLKCDNYIEYISKLEKEINSLIIKINKTKSNIDYLNKFSLLNAKLHLKKLSLPIYYEYIFENKKEELSKFNLSEQDIQNILNYKKNLDLTEILSLITNYENADLNLLKEYNYLLNDINILNKRKKEFTNDLILKSNDIKEIIVLNEKEIAKLKARYQELVNTKDILLSKYDTKYISNKNKESTKKARKSSIIINYNELYFKTINIFNNLSEYINYNFSYIKKPKFTENLKEIILYNFEKIEALTNVLLKKINKFKEDNPDKAKIFKNMMIENRKMRNDLEQRKKNELILKLKKEKVAEKNKKVISIKRVNIYNYNLMAKYKKRNKPKKIIKADTIFDYLTP